MSHYGPPGSPPPGEPYRPAGDDRPPADPWGGAPEPSWGQRPTTPSGGHPSGGYPPGGYPPGGYPPPTPSPPPPGSPPRSNVGLYALVAVLVLLAAAGVGYALFLLSGDGEPGAGDLPGPTSTAGSTASPGVTPSPGDNLGMSAVVARVDDCLVNEGSPVETQMRIVRCDEEPDGAEVVVYRVLAVLEQQVQGEDDQTRQNSAQQICSATEGYTHHYFEVAAEDSFVLCMAEVG